MNISIEKITEFMRAAVRPIITLVGFFTVCALVLKLGFQFGDRELAVFVLGEFFGFIGAMIAWWFRERSQKTIPPASEPKP